MQIATKTTHVHIVLLAYIHNLIAYKNVKALIVMFVNHDRFANICQCCSAPLRYWVKWFDSEYGKVNLCSTSLSPPLPSCSVAHALFASDL